MTDNIRRRGQLESVPFCALTQDGTRIEIISGHHRIRSGKLAGIKEFYVILDVSGLNRSKITAKQIARNAISGFDGQSTLKELVKLLDDVDDMIESYASKDILGEVKADVEKNLNLEVKFDWKNLLLLFLPHQIEDFDKLVDATTKLSPDYIGVADIEQYKLFLETLAKYQFFADVKNAGTAVHAMVKHALDAMNEKGYSESVQWVQLSSIFGAAAVSKDDADIISFAVDKMTDEGLIDKKNKLKFLKILSESGGRLFTVGWLNIPSSRRK